MKKTTKTKTTAKWKLTPHGNEIKKVGKAHLSYRAEMPDTPIDELIVWFAPLVGQTVKSRVGKNETALNVNNTWYILNGDFRKDYDKCKTVSDCLKVYKKNIKHRSDFSTDRLNG